MLKYSDLICTPLELKRFANELHNLSAFNFARFIECESKFKYTIIEIEFLIDAFKVFEQIKSFADRVDKEFRGKWQEVSIPTVKLY